MDEHFQIKLAMANRQHEHFLKLLDLFETRQTWAFNFAILLYTAAFTIFGVLLDKMYKPEQGWSPEYHMVVAGVLVLSVALPVLMLPLCFLYSDVSVFCAALTEGNRGHFDSTFKKLSKDATPYCPPGVLAFRWLHSDGRLTAHVFETLSLAAVENIGECCQGARLVCEDHPEHPWGGASDHAEACHCGGAGMPCPVRNWSPDGERPATTEGYRSFIRREW